MKHKKIIFQLEIDEDGYPPVAFEGIWAVPLPNGHMRIDNVPFYVSGISLGDEVEVKCDTNTNGEHWFFCLTKPSKNSTFRVSVSDLSNLSRIRQQIEALGCKAEVDETAGLIAFTVPGEMKIHPILDYIVDGKESGEFDFEEAALRHEI